MLPEEESNFVLSSVDPPLDQLPDEQNEPDTQPPTEQLIAPDAPPLPETPEPREPAPGTMDSTYFSLILHACETLQADFQSKLKYDAHKEKIIDTLHAELQTYRNGLLEKLLRPILMDVIEVVDDTRKIWKDLSAKGEADNPERLHKIVAGLPQDLEDLLYKHGVEVLPVQDDQFNPALHKVVKTVETDDESLDMKVCERLKNGYSLDGKLIRHEMVTVWQFKK